MDENYAESRSAGTAPGERACAYRILRYTPNLVRDEWVSIGVRRLHPQVDETLLRALRDDLEDRFQFVNGSNGGNAN